MKFATPEQQQCYEKILPWLQERFEDILLPDYGFPVVIVLRGSAAAMVEVIPWGQDALIRTWSYVVTGADLKPDLLQFLLRQNVGMSFGAFGVDDDGNIRFEHAIVGSTSDAKELQASVSAVLEAADRYDDQIVSEWGGRRAVDRYLSAPSSLL